MASETARPQAGRDFIRDIIDAEIAAGRNTEVVTRFPPECEIVRSDMERLAHREIVRDVERVPIVHREQCALHPLWFRPHDDPWTGPLTGRTETRLLETRPAGMQLPGRTTTL